MLSDMQMLLPPLGHQHQCGSVWDQGHEESDVFGPAQ